ncbi:MAG: hypothetical protein SGI97_04510 [candidate division Zixibacteria bacterium]|nr:hypothetical protein [candidate division Zixibacteria bacterium]
MKRLVEKYFSEFDLAAIEQAVNRAEQKTEGEIAVQIAPYSRNWTMYRLSVSAAFALAGLWLALFITQENNWGISYNFAQGALGAILGFVAGYLLFPLLFGRREEKRKLVWNRGLLLFSQLTPTRGKTGVLLFISLAESQAAVIADKRIAEKITQQRWDEIHSFIVKGLSDHKHSEGMIKAIDEVGKDLALHFPRLEGDSNELPNRPTILS